MGEAERKLRERENGQEKTAVSLNPYDVQLQIRPATLYRPSEKCRAVIAAAPAAFDNRETMSIDRSFNSNLT
jgi:hypothetical protein